MELIKKNKIRVLHKVAQRGKMERDESLTISTEYGK